MRGHVIWTGGGIIHLKFMVTTLSLAVCFLLTAQSETTRQAQNLVEKLRSDKIEEREQAVHKLKQLGKAALPELEKVVEDPDREVAERARHLLRFIGIATRIPPGVAQALPGIEERLDREEGFVWTKLFHLAVVGQPASHPPRLVEANTSGRAFHHTPCLSLR